MRHFTRKQRTSFVCLGIDVGKPCHCIKQRYKNSASSVIPVPLRLCIALLIAFCTNYQVSLAATVAGDSADAAASIDIAELKDRINLSPFIRLTDLKNNARDNNRLVQLISPAEMPSPPLLRSSQIDSETQPHWHTNNNTRIDLKEQKLDHWFKVSLSNSSDESKTRILSFEYALASALSMYEYNPDTGTTRQLFDQLGLLKPFNDRPINYRYLSQEIVLPAHATREYFWSIYQSSPISVQITASTPEYFEIQTQHEQLFFGIVYGMLIMLSIYNLFVYFTTKEKAHLCFVLLSALVIPLVASLEGHLYQFIAPDQVWPKRQLLLGFIATQQPAFALFASYFLNLRERVPIFYRGFIVFSILCMLLWCYFLLGLNQPTLINLAPLGSALLYMSAAAAAIYLAFRGINTARFFVLSLGFSVLVDLALRTDFPGNLIANTINTMPSSAGYLTMIFLFSLALGRRIKNIQEEKIAASMALVKLTEDKLKSNVELYKSKVQHMELEKRADEAKIESRAKSEFLAAMSHEIRTPMSGVLGMTELLKDTDLSPTQERYVSTINSSGQALLNVINDLLDYSKIEAGKMQLETVTFNLDELLDDCVSIFALKASEKNINFIGSIKPGTEVFLKGDPTKLRQIILNLLSNAFKFTESGDVTIYVYPTNKTSINSLELRFDVKDTGIGLTHDEQRTLFDPFSQADISTSRKYGGTGLGLAICKQLAELMNGTIGVNSAPGQGSTFWFTARLFIPQSNERPLSEPIHPALVGKRILICDEHPAFLDACLIIASAWDMRVTVSSSANETLQQIRDSINEAHPIDFLIAPVDLAHNKENIFILANRCCQTLPEEKRPKFIATTTTSRLHKQLVDKLSLSVSLPKPLTKKLLKECLLHCLDIREEEISTVSERPIYNFDHLHVLVAEDNKVNAMVIEGLLNKLRIYPTLVENGAQALQVMIQKEGAKAYDLILMDCEMPIMDGYEATQQIRQFEAQNTVAPIIIVGLSAHASSEYQDKAMQAGMDDYITKPVNKGDIESILRKFFSDKGSITQLPVAG